jgi:hypothetical protein
MLTIMRVGIGVGRSIFTNVPFPEFKSSNV